MNPTIINYNGMLIFAIIGLVVNLIATYFTHGGHSINQKAVNLHMLEDVLGWLVVLIGAIVIKFTAFYIIDPILSIIVALFVIFNSMKNLIQIMDIFLIKVPKDVDVNELVEHIKHVDGVIDVHHVHVWSLDGEITYATLHIITQAFDSKIKSKVKKELAEHGISHSTVEMESFEENCEEKLCNIKSSNPHEHCHHHHH